jgi:hypothetical protein
MQPAVVFCTTCKGRTKHLEKTLPQNIADNRDYENLKFVILDYNSPDHLLAYLKRNHRSEIESGRVVVYNFTEPGPFRMAHAKNMAHRLGMLEGADIMVNLDADNYTGPGFASYVSERFQEKSNIFLWAKIIPGQGRRFRGCSGRIAVTKEAFLLAGGYDEKFATWSPDDKDFNARLCNLGYEAVEIDTQYLCAVPHPDGVRFQEYPHAKPTDQTSSELEYVNTGATVVNYGQCGMGFVVRNCYPDPVRLGKLPTRIFGVGLHKTATTSLSEALTVLGYRSGHWESGDWAKAIWAEMITEKRSVTLEKYYAASDLPIALLYKELDRSYPGSKFILTIRDEQKWLESVKNHWTYERNRFRWEWDIYPFSNQIHKQLYGQETFDAEVFLARYRKHNADVREYFKDRNDLLIMDMDDSAGWLELCSFLGNPIPSIPYPVKYATVN